MGRSPLVGVEEIATVVDCAREGPGFGAKWDEQGVRDRQQGKKKRREEPPWWGEALEGDAMVCTEESRSGAGWYDVGVADNRWEESQMWGEAPNSDSEAFVGRWLHGKGWAPLEEGKPYGTQFPGWRGDPPTWVRSGWLEGVILG